ncbi:choloylglycine hydrolase [Natronincola peptidivorans]|uniref:Choloylglycine hydrolase n=1 Tax=Natronincola peptidivorans TaxID=426128 RepID=A0A1I0B421_9FIRM|nr:linear amide C-N hydrolase [Natronincola peptidivorans]SET00712.1 choloylglycine hydrolase [Natronincola peptidivorans]
MRSMVGACSEFMLKGHKKARVSGRTMDWFEEMYSNFVVVPRGTHVFSYYDGEDKEKQPLKQGMQWKTKYGFVGIDSWNLPIYLDGMNEMGLSAGLLALYGCGYPEPDKCPEKNISIGYLLQYVLGNCKDVNEVKEFLESGVTVCDLSVLYVADERSLHLVVHDAQGKSLVLEAEDGEIKIYLDEEASVLTNSPFLHWHLLNMRNYCNLTYKDATSDGPWTPLGHGSGMLGLPGDSTPPSRFVRLSMFREFSPISKDANEEVQQAFHMINRVALVNGEDIIERTLWEVVRDHVHRIYYFRTNQNQSIRAIDLKEIDFSGFKQYKRIPLTTGNLYEDVTPLFEKG